jgi:hypothetical protein
MTAGHFDLVKRRGIFGGHGYARNRTKRMGSAIPGWGDKGEAIMTRYQCLMDALARVAVASYLMMAAQTISPLSLGAKTTSTCPGPMFSSVASIGLYTRYARARARSPNRP